MGYLPIVKAIGVSRSHILHYLLVQIISETKCIYWYNFRAMRFCNHWNYCNWKWKFILSPSIPITMMIEIIENEFYAQFKINSSSAEQIKIFSLFVRLLNSELCPILDSFRYELQMQLPLHSNIFEVGMSVLYVPFRNTV